MLLSQLLPSHLCHFLLQTLAPSKVEVTSYVPSAVLSQEVVTISGIEDTNNDKNNNNKGVNLAVDINRCVFYAFNGDMCLGDVLLIESLCSSGALSGSL